MKAFVVNEAYVGEKPQAPPRQLQWGEELIDQQETPQRLGGVNVGT